LDGLTTQCKECRNAWRKEYEQKHSKQLNIKEPEVLSDEKKLMLSEKIETAIISIKEVAEYILHLQN
jgi:hypothetical protein